MPAGRKFAMRLMIFATFAVAGILSVPALEPAAAPPAPTPPAVNASAMDALAGPAAAGDLEVMTFNLRYATTRQPNSWAQRRPVMRTLLTTELPDLLGTQEGLAAQLADIQDDLGAGYDYIGTGREGGTNGEFNAIFYAVSRLSPQTAGHFWLSDTPEVPGSNTWGAFSTRMVTWVRFLDRETGKRFHAANTHLDNVSENARRRSAQLIRARLTALDPALPIILTGDFNTPAQVNSDVYTTLVDQAGYRDTWTTAPVHGPAYGTVHNYLPPWPNGQRVDWILTTPGITAPATLMNTYRAGSQFPSDHLPIQARLHLP